MRRVAGSFLLLLWSGASACVQREPEVKQPIEFNHAIHVVKKKVPCTDCHVGADENVHATLPTIQRCLLCHMKPQGKQPNPREQMVRRIAATGRPVEWIQLFRLPDHVFFSHARHVGVAGLRCTTCHADMPKRTRPPQERRSISMSACIECHEHRASPTNPNGAILDCSECHR
jgi:hypothetical protein